MFQNFSSPHCHLQSLDTGSTLEEFLKRELELNTGTMTCTDHGYLGACLDVYKMCKENNLTPILGVEAYHRDDNCEILTNHGIEKVDGKFDKYYKYGHLTIHALDQSAYQKLVKKISDADLTGEQHGSERKPIFTWKDLEELGSENVTMTSGCLIGVVSRHIMANRPEIAVKYYEKIRSLAKPGNFFVELFPHRCDKNWVSGVFITLEGGKQLKYYLGKKVRTQECEEISVADLSKLVAKGKPVGKLLAIKNRSTWEEIEPKEIISCEMIQDFVENECQPWCPDGDVQLGANKFLLALAQKYGDKVQISDDSHYAYPDEKVIQNAKLGGMGDNFRFYGDYHRHSSEEVYQYFKERMGFSEEDFRKVLQNNIDWAARFKDFKLEYKISLPTSFYPSNTIQHIKELIDKHGRMDWKNRAMVTRLQSEINLLYKNGTIDLLPYFFLAEESVEQYVNKGELPGPGRGSAAGLLLSYLLDITHADPLRYDLSQDRFLTIDRIQTGKLPDIDQDLPNREILIPWLKERFGDCFAQISTNNLLRVKNSIKDVARATWGEVPYETEKLCKSIPSTPQGIEDRDFLFGYTGDDGKEVKGFISESKELQAYVAKYPEQWKIVQKLLGVMRNKGKHASGFIVANKPIDQFIPLMTVNEVRCTQYTAEGCEFAGALKMDYLCLNSLIDLSQALKMIQARSGVTLEESHIINGKRVPRIRIVPHNGKLLDIYDLPEDQDVFRSICQGETETVFQLNTHSARQWLKEFDHWKNEKEGKKSIDSIDAVAAFTALDRPGPLDAPITDGVVTRNMLQEYAARMRGSKPLDPIPFMMENLMETVGVMVFQEQLQSIYQQLTDCSGIDANKFRNDIGKKEMQKVLKRYPFFMEKATEKIGKETAQKIWDQIYTFGQYGFNKSHATCYGMLAYACAYLKYHFKLEWWCAVLRNAEKNEIGEKFWKYCKDIVLLPDIQSSRQMFEIQGSKIIAPINMLLGVGPGAHAELVANVPYKDIDDFCQKIAKCKVQKTKINETTNKIKLGTSALNKGVVSKLIVSGVMDSLFPSGLDIVSKLEMYQTSLAKALEKKRPEKIDQKYSSLNSLKIYQHRKSILPVYSSWLVPHLYDLKIDGISRKVINYKSGDMYNYSYLPEKPETINLILKSSYMKSMFKQALPFVDGIIFAQMNESASIPMYGSCRVAVGAYVVEVKSFEYTNKQNGKKLKSYKFVLDIDGNIVEMVKWANREGKENFIPPGELEGSIVVAILSKRKEYDPFQIDAILKIEEPLAD